jgi:hypothetical protein
MVLVVFMKWMMQHLSTPSNGLVVVFIGSTADQNGSGCVYEEDAALCKVQR